MAGMNANTLFSQALGLGAQWNVVKSEMDVAQRQLRLELDFPAGTKFACPRCGQLCAVHDTVDKEWRHLDFWQHRTDLRARVPRVTCAEHGVLQVEVPWARAGSGFTLMMEGMILLLAQQMSVSAAARLLRTTDHRLWRVIDHYVTAAHRDKDWSKVRRILVDEPRRSRDSLPQAARRASVARQTSARRGRRYVTNVIDAESTDLLMMAKDRGADTLGEFAAAMTKHGGRPEQITEIVMDMSPAYIAGAAAYFPGARVVFDAFHIMSRPQGDRQPKAARRVRRSRINMAGQALDKVRKDLARKGGDLRGGLWALRGNAWTRNSEQQERRSQLMATYPALGRAVALREFLQDALAGSDRSQLEAWLAWAQRSRLAAFRDLARTIKRHFNGILAYMETRLTNGVMEAINGLLQLAKRIARGFRNFYYFRLAAYLKAGGLNLQAPRLLPT
jgi:transposase